jgi:two-component system, chemotaxis family, chemotaxis protein CheY
MMKILVAEDEEGIAMTYEIALRARGHEVTITINGRLCLQEYQLQHSSSPFDVVILDYRMPEMDGYDAAKRILEINPDQRIVFASAYGKETLEAMIKKIGVVAEILQKPFELDTLVDTIEDRFIYSQLQSLKVSVGDLKTWNPSHQQLSFLLDALLRLRDPKLVFAQLNPSGYRISSGETIETNRKQRDVVTSRSTHDELSRNDSKTSDSKAIAGIIEEALRYLGPEWLSIFFYHLASLGVQKEDIADNPEQFTGALDKLLGSASGLVKAQIFKAIESNQEEFGTSSTIANFKAKVSEASCIPSSGDIGGAAN